MHFVVVYTHTSQMSYHILEVYKITCISSKSSSWYKYFVYTVLCMVDYIHCRIWRHCTPLLELGTTSTWVTHLATAPFQTLLESVVNTKSLLTIFLKILQRSLLVWLNGELFFRKMFVSLSFGLLCVSFLRTIVSRWRTTCNMFVPLSFSTVTLGCAHVETHTYLHT